jgi:hypothetical protein
MTSVYVLTQKWYEAPSIHCDPVTKVLGVFSTVKEAKKLGDKLAIRRERKKDPENYGYEITEYYVDQPKRDAPGFWILMEVVNIGDNEFEVNWEIPK